MLVKLWDAKTGKLKWHYQTTPHDIYDHDDINETILADIPWGNGRRPVLLRPGRNGFFYSLDRGNGSFIKGGQYVNELNWTKGLDPKTGKPVDYDPNKDLQTYSGAAAVTLSITVATAPSRSRASPTPALAQ